MVVTLVSALGVLLLIGVAWVFGFRTDPVLDEATARAEAEARLPGFRAAEVALARDGRGAVLRGLDGSLALLLPLADGWVARRLRPDASPRLAGCDLELSLAEPGLRRVRLPLVAAPPWLGPAGGRPG